MAHHQRPTSVVLFASGVLLIAAGVAAALGGTAAGVLTSVAAVAALLYAGAVWSRDARGTTAAPPAIPFVVFDKDRRVVTGPAAGQLIAMQFPEMLRQEIEHRCAAAIAGTRARFLCIHNSRPVAFDALPVRNADGTVVYGVLLASEPGPSALPAGA